MASEVVGVEGVDTVEVVDLVMVVFQSQNTTLRMRTHHVQRNRSAIVLGTCSSMTSGYSNACLTLMLGHPTSLAMRTHCHPIVLLIIIYCMQ